MVWVVNQLLKVTETPIGAADFVASCGTIVATFRPIAGLWQRVVDRCNRVGRVLREVCGHDGAGRGGATSPLLRPRWAGAASAQCG